MRLLSPLGRCSFPFLLLCLISLECLRFLVVMILTKSLLVEREKGRGRGGRKEREKLSSWTDFQSWFPGALIEPTYVASFWMKEEAGPVRSPRLLPDATFWRSAATDADSIIIIKFNWHATSWPIVAMPLNGLDFLSGCFPRDRFCFVPNWASIRLVKSVKRATRSIPNVNFRTVEGFSI